MKEEQLYSISRTATWLCILILCASFFMPEPFNEMFFFIAWFFFGARVLIIGVRGIWFEKVEADPVEVIVSTGPDVEIKGKKAVATGAVIVIVAILIFILPGFCLALDILLKLFSISF